MGADINTWQWPKNVAGKVIGWAANGRELENKDWVSPADLDGKQDASANLDVLAGIVPGAAGQAILALLTPASVRDYLKVSQYVATIAALKLLNGAAMTDGTVLWLCGGSSTTDGKQGYVVYRSNVSTAGDDVVYFTPADSTGRFVRYEWDVLQEIHADWWGLTIGSTAAQVANGTAIGNLFDWIDSSAATGTCYFPQGIIYVERTTAITLTKVRGWRFVGVGDAGASTGSGTRFYLRGGGMDYFIKYRTVIQYLWERCLFLVDGSGMAGVFDVGSANYYDTDGVTPIDTAAISSYLCEWKNCTFTSNVGAGFSPSASFLSLHSAVTNKLTACWLTGANTALFLGAAGNVAGDPDGRTLAKGTCGQLTIEDCLIDGDIVVRKLGGFRMTGGQITRQSGVSPSAAGARFTASSLELCENVTFDGVGGMGYGGDFSGPFISSSMIINGLTITPSCNIGGYSYVAVAGGASNNWDVSPTWSSVNSQVVGATGILQIQSGCTGKNIGSRSTIDSRVANVVSDSRTIQDFRPAWLKGTRAIDFISLVDGAGTTQAVTVTGAALLDPCLVSLGVDLQGMTLTSYVGSANTVNVRLQNETTGTIDLANTTMNGYVMKVSI